MKFLEAQVEGLAKCLVAENLDPQRLRLHLTEVEAGTRSHPAHAHTGLEVFYMLEGHATVEVEDEHYALGPNEAILLDASRPHGIANTGSTRMRYLVIITP